MTILSTLLIATLFAPGIKELDATLEISPPDAGKVFASSDPAKPAVLSGGRTITGWRVGTDGVWRVTLPEVKSGKWNFSQLFVNGERRKRPCVPANGFYLTAGNAYTNEPGMPCCGFVYNPKGVTLRDDYANVNDIEVEVFYNWSVAKMRLADIDLANRRVRFTSGRRLSKTHSNHVKPRRWHLENVKEAFGRAGEWYLDRPTGVLSYKPFPGETPESCRVVAPYLKQILRVVGEKGRPVKDVVFRNVRFRYANVVVPEDGAYVVQGELDVPAAVELNRAENVRFESCAFESVGGWAIAFGPGCYGNAVESCLLYDLGAGGVKIGAPYGGYTTIDAGDSFAKERYSETLPGFEDKAWDLTGDTRVENCRMVHGGAVYHAGMGVLAGRTWGAKILHNEIAHFDYTAISVGWDWDNKVVMAHDNEVAWNHCWDLGRRVLSDMGIIYTLGNQPGTTIHDNHLHGIDVFEYGGKGIYLDECTSHVKVYNNLVYDTRCSHSQSYTIDCEVYNNIFFCPKGANLLWRTRVGADDVAMNAHHNILVWNGDGEAFEHCNDFKATQEERRKDELRRPNPANGAKLDRNLYWKIGDADPKRLFRPKKFVNQEAGGDRTEHPYLDFPSWQSVSGMDAHSVYADPKFVDAGAFDFRLGADSPALGLGFKPFDYHRAGLSDPKRVPAAELRELKASVLNVQRSLRKMASSTAERPACVRVLFYGQSLVEQGWCTNILATLRKRYPTVDFIWENRAVGGFESPLLVRASETDLYPYYPDLVFFNDYGDTEVVRAMIERLKARTTAEVVIWTDRIRRKEDPRLTVAEDDARSRALMSIAEDCGCLLVHLRRKWSQMLIDERADPMKYLSDGVHLKVESGAFARIADFISEELVELDGYAGEMRAFGRIEDFQMTSGVYGEAKIVGSAFTTNADGSVDFTFVGNRVVATTAPWRACYSTSPCKVLLDGREMAGYRELFCHERASGLFSWMPILLHVGAEKTPVPEVWTLTYVEGTDPMGHPVKYRVDGSVTGFDGFGSTDADFVSNSGRVRILATDFHSWQYDYFVAGKARKGKDVSRLEARPGQWICWKTVPMFTDRISTYVFDGKAKEVVLVSGCSNAKHTLTFRPAIEGRTPVFEKLTVYTPYGFECAVTTNELAGIAKRVPVNPDFDPNRKRE